jgi:hypothetical protein
MAAAIVSNFSFFQWILFVLAPWRRSFVPLRRIVMFANLSWDLECVCLHNFDVDNREVYVRFILTVFLIFKNYNKNQNWKTVKWVIKSSSSHSNPPRFFPICQQSHSRPPSPQKRKRTNLPHSNRKSKIHCTKKLSRAWQYKMAINNHYVTMWNPRKEDSSKLHTRKLLS